MPILGGCCFCLDLKVGTKIIGVLKLISALMNSIIFAVLLVMLVFLQVGVDTAKVTATSKTTSVPSSQDDMTDESAVEQMQKLMQEHIGTVKIVLYVLLALAVVHVITSSMLIHGIRRNRRGLLLPYLVQETVALVVHIALIIAPLIVIGTMNVVVYSVLCIAVGVVVQVYFMLVVISQYQALGLIQMHEEISMK